MALALALFSSYLDKSKREFYIFTKYIFCFFLCKGTKTITQINTPPHKIVIIFNNTSIHKKTNMRPYNYNTFIYT